MGIIPFDIIVGQERDVFGSFPKRRDINLYGQGATTSLPTPVSPWMRTFKPESATRYQKGGKAGRNLT
jgi:hypothetical protein